MRRRRMTNESRNDEGEGEHEEEVSRSDEGEREHEEGESRNDEGESGNFEGEGERMRAKTKSNPLTQPPQALPQVRTAPQLSATITLK